MKLSVSGKTGKLNAAFVENPEDSTTKAKGNGVILTNAQVGMGYFYQKGAMDDEWDWGVHGGSTVSR